VCAGRSCGRRRFRRCDAAPRKLTFDNEGRQRGPRSRRDTPPRRRPPRCSPGPGSAPRCRGGTTIGHKVPYGQWGVGPGRRSSCGGAVLPGHRSRCRTTIPEARVLHSGWRPAGWCSRSTDRNWPVTPGSSTGWGTPGARPGHFACRADVEIIASRVPEGEARDRLHHLAGRDRTPRTRALLREMRSGIRRAVVSADEAGPAAGPQRWRPGRHTDVLCGPGRRPPHFDHLRKAGPLRPRVRSVSVGTTPWRHSG